MKRLLIGFRIERIPQEASAWPTKKAEKMTTELLFTAEQQKLMLPLFEEQKALYDDIKANPDNKDADRANLREIGKIINAVLTPEQIVLQKTLKANK